MNKYSHKDVHTLKERDTDHYFYSADKDFLTDELNLEQIEIRFQEALLVLAQIKWEVDFDGDMSIRAARVVDLCDTAKDAVSVMDEYSMNHKDPTCIPYFTGVTKFHKTRGVTYIVNNEQIDKAEPRDLGNVVRKVTVGDEEVIAAPPFPMSPSDDSKCVSVKDIDINPLFAFFKSISIDDTASRNLALKVKVRVNQLKAVDFTFNSFYKIVLKALTGLGLEPSVEFKDAFIELVTNSYGRLLTRNHTAIYCRDTDKQALADYCGSNGYDFYCIPTDNFMSLVSAITQSKMNRIVVSVKEINRMTVLESKIMCQLSEKYEISVDIIG